MGQHWIPRAKKIFSRAFFGTRTIGSLAMLQS
jgi:hypothetical protein